MYLKEKGVNTRNWVDSAQERGYWRAYMDAVLNLRNSGVMELVFTKVLFTVLPFFAIYHFPYILFFLKHLQCGFIVVEMYPTPMFWLFTPQSLSVL